MRVPVVDLGNGNPQLNELVAEAECAGELVLTRGGEAVAKIVPLHSRREPRRPGSARLSVLFMADDFDATPEEFKDYL